MGWIIMIAIIGGLGLLGFSFLGPLGAVIGVVLGLIIVAKMNS